MITIWKYWIKLRW